MLTQELKLIPLYEVLTLTAVGGYFTLRSLVYKRPPKPLPYARRILPFT